MLDHGKTTYAQVTYKDSTRHRHSTTWSLSYKYRVGKTDYTARNDVREAQYYAVGIGSRLYITYLPETPWMTEIGPVTQQTMNDQTFSDLTIAGGISLLFLLVVFGTAASIRAQVRLMRYGSEGQAIVASKRETGGRRKSSATYLMTCNFYDGQQPASKEFNVDHKFYDAVPIGSSLSVVYIPTKPQTSMLYKDITDVVIEA